MRPAPGAILRWGGRSLLWLAAAVGVALSAAALFAALPATRPLAARALIRWADEAVAGRVELEGIAVLPHGGIEVRSLRVFDPEGRPVLSVERARIFADVFGLAGREVGVSLELDGVDVDAALRSDDGGLALAEAFAPNRPAGKAPPRGAAPPDARRAEPAEGRGGWAVRIGRLAMTRARVRFEGVDGAPIEATGATLDARGQWARGEAWGEARLRGALAAPVAAPLGIDLRAAQSGDRVELQRLSVALGEDRLEAVGEGDLSRLTGRLALTRLGVSGRQTGALAPAARLAGELSGTLYAEADGEVATAALAVAPADGGAAGRADVAFAARLPPAAFAWGVAADVDRLDPARLSLLAPPGRVTLRGRGAAAGTKLAELAGRLGLRLERSRLRGGELGPVELSATARAGRVEVSRLEAAAPGGTVSGRLRWQEGQDVSGELSIVAGDLDRLERNLAAVLGRRVPDLEGSGTAAVTLSGTSRAPRLEARVDAARLGVGNLGAEGARLRVELAGPAAALTGRVQGRLDRAHVGGLELHGAELDAALREAEGSLSLTANVPELGTDLVRVQLRGRFEERRSAFALAEAVFAWPGTRFELDRPARIDLEAPAVDRLALAAGTQRIEVEGGLRRGGALDGRVRLAGIELARLPRGLIPPEAAAEGLLTVDARVGGTRAAPRVDATVGLTGAVAYEVGGLQLLGEVAWDGELERIDGDLGLQRERGGAVELSFDLPVALGRARAYEEIRVDVHGQAVPLDELVWLAGSYALISGDIDLTASLGGSVGAPVLRASGTLRNGSWDELEGVAIDAAADAAEDRLRLRATGAMPGTPAAALEGTLALGLSRLLARPGDALAAARRGALTLALRLPAVALKPLAGWLDLPPDLDGRLEGEATLGGTPAAPRGTARLALADAAGWGARRVGGRLDVALAPDRTGATLELALAGRPAARLDATVDLPAERLLDRGALAAAAGRLDLALPRADLADWGGELLPLGGTVEGRATLRGTLGAPHGELSLSAEGAVVEGRPLGRLALEGRYAAGRTTLGADLRPPAGGELHADAAIGYALGIGATPGPLSAAPAELRVRADRLDLGFLPALAPGVVRAASGAATVDLSAAGPLAELRPRGTFRVAKGRLAVAELGEWRDAVIEADLGEDTVELRRFDVRKGAGTLSLRATVRGLSKRGEPAEVEAALRSEDFGVERAGMELARFDLAAEARGTLTREALTVGVVVPQAEVKLPKRIPRTLQELGTRKDITVGRPRPVRARRTAHDLPAAAVAEGAAPSREPFKTVVHLAAPRRFRVRADQPRIDVELKADALFAFAGSRAEATGWVEAIRGQVEPLGGRVFAIERGKVTFTGGPPAAGVLDVAARYENPTAVVRATITGTLSKPELHLSSEPPLQEAQIAMLVATGRTEVKAGSEGVNTLAAGEAGLAAAGAVVTGVFKDLLSDKLPVDSVSLDSTAVKAGKYLTDRIYVGYVRRFDAKPEKGENPDEVRVEYQLAPGWQVETRYGSGQSGGASIVWTRSY